MRQCPAGDGKARDRQTGPHRDLDPESESLIPHEEPPLADLQSFLGQTQCKQAFKHGSEPTCFCLLSAANSAI